MEHTPHFYFFQEVIFIIIYQMFCIISLVENVSVSPFQPVKCYKRFDAMPKGFIHVLSQNINIYNILNERIFYVPMRAAAKETGFSSFLLRNIAPATGAEKTVIGSFPYPCFFEYIPVVLMRVYFFVSHYFSPFNSVFMLKHGCVGRTYFRIGIDKFMCISVRWVFFLYLESSCNVIGRFHCQRFAFLCQALNCYSIFSH